MTPSISAADVLEELPWLRAFAARLASPADVDDLVSQTWIAAWEQGARVEVDPRGPRPWLGAVLRNKARMLQRGRVRRQAREARVTADVSEVVHQDLTRLSVLADVVAAIRRLPEDDQAMVVQRYYEGRTSVEIGAALGLEAATVRSRLKRSLSRLRADLDERHGGERAAWAGALGVGAKAESGAPLLLWGLGLATAAGIAATAMLVVGGGAPESSASAVAIADETPDATMEEAVAEADVRAQTERARNVWEARKARVVAANRAFVPTTDEAPGPDAVAELAGNFAALQQVIFDDCVADLSLAGGTAFVVRSQVIGAPGVGTVVAEVEIDEGARGSDALLECVREGMYVLHGEAPMEPFEAEMSFGIGNPEATEKAEADADEAEEEVEPADASDAQQASVERQAAGAQTCVGAEAGSAVLLLGIGEDGAVANVRFQETTLSLEVIDCVADHALQNWTLDAAAGDRLRVSVQFPNAQASP